MSKVKKGWPDWSEVESVFSSTSTTFSTGAYISTSTPLSTLSAIYSTTAGTRAGWLSGTYTSSGAATFVVFDEIELDLVKSAIYDAVLAHR